MPLMCNNVVETLEELTIDFIAMDSNRISRTNSAGNEENPRAKFLCSFGGSVLPRPLDGKLRYVGGETRIVSVPRNIRYEELMGRMRELYEVASILKYQQPDEDLDALVSVVNDDDVTNMMEEYDKLLGSGDGFTRLRIFLFSHLDQEASPQYMEGDERDTEKRYVDALNSLNESPDYRRYQFSDGPMVAPFDEIHIADQLFNSMNLDGSVHNQRNYEMGMPPYNLGQLASPGQHGALVTQLHTEEPSWSPGYSPQYAGAHEPRTFAELASPSAARFRMDRMAEETTHQQLSRQLSFERRQQYFDHGVWLPTGPMPVDMGGFPGNMLNGPNVVDCPSVCQHCKTTLQRSPSISDLHRKPEEQSHVEQSTMRNGFTKVATPCVECVPRAPISGVGRMGDQCTLDGPSTKVPIGPGNLPDGNLVPTTYALHEVPHHIRAELGGEIFHGQVIPYGSHVQVPSEERGVHTANLPLMQGAEIPHLVSHGSTSALAKQTNSPSPLHVLPHDPSNVQPRDGIPSGVVPNPRGVVEGSARFFAGVDQSPFESPQRRLGGDGSTVPEYPYGHLSKLNPHSPFPEIQQIFAQDPLGNAPNMLRFPPPIEVRRPSELPSVMLNGHFPSSNARDCGQLRRQDTCNSEAWSDERSIHCGASESTRSREAESLDVDDVHPHEQNSKSDISSTEASLNVVKSNSVNPSQGSEDSILKRETKALSSAKSGELTSLPERIASAEGAKLEGAEGEKAGAQKNGDAVILHNAPSEVENAVTDGTKSPHVKSNSGGGSENECAEASKIEPTKAEEEAFAKGLQTIKNADLEEVRELGTGTYGAVYHGKWKGSDVAIKRIKASCFDGRPSERERLIADFWKEALILSSLHHPNVVAFYGVVRDGPDGSLATVTEFMVNGSLKQFLRKKDRTIDRRKRLIIAMDAAFGMEYLHEKNIVHFDLKCENLLVNMRDPHRPVCKIGDLGLSKVKQQTLVSGGVRGTLPWMAPELLSGKSHMVTEKIDVYSFGIVMWELLTGEEPYSDMHCASLIGGIVNNTLRPEIPTWCDPEWKALMESCWSCDSAERPSFLEISQKLRTMAAAMNLK